MASKRSLYRPAPENVTSKQTRHFLAQGRLTTKPSLPDSLTVYASPHHLQRPLADEGGDASTIISHAPIDDGSLSPRQQMAAYVHSPQQSMSSASYIDTPISDSLTRSPAKPKPEQLLELSDSDEEITFHKKKTPLKHVTSNIPLVEIVDASGGRKDLNTSEVTAQSNVIPSPAKVSCHSPAVIASDLRNTGYTETNAKIKMDGLPSYSLLGDEDFTENTETKKTTKKTQPLVVRETILADGLRPRHSSGARQMKSPDNISGMEDIVMLPDFGEQAVLPLETSANRSSTLKSVDEKSGNGVKKKKPKGRIVSSRYMQGFNTTLPSKPNVTTNRDSETHSKMMRKTATTSSKGRPVSKLHTKPRRSLVTSTPFAGTLGTIPVNSPMFSGDGSYFQPPSAIKTDSKKARPKSRQAVGLPSPMDITSKTPASFIDVEVAAPQEITQDYLNVLYARYIQWVFFSSKMDKVMEEREKDAMSEIYWIWNENEMLSLRKAELETELVDLHYKNKLDELLKVQREGLGPIVSGLDQLKKQHNTLAQAVDTTRHHVPTKGINIPVNERDYLVDMGKALNETEQLLGEIHMLTREHQPQVKECAKSIGALKDATLNEGVELYRLNEVMAAVSTLTTHETSLKIQHMDLKDPRAAELNQLDITKSVLEQ